MMTWTPGLDSRVHGRISMLERAVDVAARDNWPIDVVVAADEVESQQRGTVFEAHRGARRLGSGCSCWRWAPSRAAKTRMPVTRT
jgi:hypothetical protein